VKQLVFALMLETLSDKGLVVEEEEYGVWADLNKCIYFARSISLQGIQGEGHITFREAFPIPVRAYCKPKYVNPNETVIFD